MLPKDVKKMSLEDLKEANPDLYNQIVTTTKADAEKSLVEVQKENAKLKNDASIRENAMKLGLTVAGEDMISKGLSLSDALPQLIKLKASGVTEDNVLKQQFIKTAPPAAGGGDMKEVTGPKNQEEAIKLQMESGLSRLEAVRKARKANPDMFIGHLKQTALQTNEGVN